MGQASQPRGALGLARIEWRGIMVAPIEKVGCTVVRTENRQLATSYMRKARLTNLMVHVHVLRLHTAVYHYYPVSRTICVPLFLRVLRQEL